MATKTKDYELIKPDIMDFYDIWVQNANMDTIDDELKGLEDGKVDKVVGKGLSSTDVTQAEKNSWNGKQPSGDYATNTALVGKVDKVTGKVLSTNDYTTAEKAKLAGMAVGANNYVHPDNANTRHVSDAEKETWNNAKGKKYTTFVIGIAGVDNPNEVDYLCDPLNGQIAINQAIQDLPTGGGKIILKWQQEVVTTASININKANVTLEGLGACTVLKRGYEGELRTGFVIVDKDNCIIAGLNINGNKNIYKEKRLAGLSVLSSDNLIINNIVINNEENGISIGSSSVTFNCTNNIITNNICKNNTNNGIAIYGNSNKVSNNICEISYNHLIFEGRHGGVNKQNGNNITGNICRYGGDGITSQNMYSNITGNIIENALKGINAGDFGVITANLCNNNNYGIYLERREFCSITGNVCKDNKIAGIHMEAYDTNVRESINAVTGNICIRGMGNASDYTSIQETIHLKSGKYSIISSNHCMGKNIRNDGGSTNTIVNNKYN